MKSEKLENLKEYTEGILTEKQWGSLLKDFTLSDFQALWPDLSDDEQLRVFLHIGKELRSDLIPEFDSDQQEHLIQNISAKAIKELLDFMEPDDLVDLIQSLSPSVRKAVWENISDQAREETEFLLRFDDDDAAGLMTPRYVAVRAGITVKQALAYVRKVMNDMETVYYIYVVDELKRLIGVCSLKQLLAGKDNSKISSIMTENVIFVLESTDQEQAAHVLEDNNLIAIPVIDKIHRILGIITFDDVIDVIRDEQTEDIYKMGAMSGDTRSYLNTGIFGLLLKRLPWIVILLLAGTITTNLLYGYSDLIAAAVFIILFIPVITQTGGNSGVQSSTLMIRGLATGEIRFQDIGRIVLKEISVGLLMGLVTAVIIFARGHFLPPGITTMQGVAIGTSLACVVVFASVVGAVVPLILNKIGVDPTTAAGPLMSTVIDVCGLTIYFEVCKLILQL